MGTAVTQSCIPAKPLSDRGNSGKECFEGGWGGWGGQPESGLLLSAVEHPWDEGFRLGSHA